MCVTIFERCLFFLLYKNGTNPFYKVGIKSHTWSVFYSYNFNEKIADGICEPLSVSNGYPVYSNSPVGGKYLVDTLAFFNCEKGYKKEGPDYRICLASGKWDEKNQNCKKGNKINWFF